MSLLKGNSDVVWINRNRDQPRVKGKKATQPRDRKNLAPVGMPVLEPCQAQGYNGDEKALLSCDRLADSPLPILISRAEDSTIVYANKHFRQLFGINPEEHLGRVVDFYENPRQRVMLLDVLQREGCVRNYDLLVKKADGTRFWVAMSVQSLTLEGDLVFFKTFRDITKFKQADQILQTIASSQSPIAGDSFFPCLAYHLGSLLPVRCVVISERIGHSLERLQVLGFWERDPDGSSLGLQNASPGEYTLAGTPCAQVVQGAQAWHAKNLTEYFSPDHPLARLKGCSYFGVPLTDINGTAIGAISLFADRPFCDLHSVESLVRIFAAHSSTELERQRTERALRASETRLQMALKAAKMGLWEWDLRAGTFSGSEELETILGLPPGSFDGTPSPFWQAIHPEDRGTVEKMMARAIADRSSYHGEYRIVYAQSQTVRWMVCKADVLCEGTGGVVRMVGTIAEASDRKKTEAALTESSANLQAIFNASVASILFIDSDYKIQAFNKAAAEAVWGIWKREICAGDSIYDYVAPEDVKDFNRDFHAALNGQSVSLQRNIKGIGNTENWFEINYQPVFSDRGEVMGVCFRALNITERFLAMDALAQSEERFRLLVQHSSDLITILAADGTIRYQSPSIEKILGYPQSELVGQSAFDYVHPEDRERVCEQFAQALRTDGEAMEIEFRFRNRSGEWVYLDSVGSNQLNAPGIHGFVINSRDVTERKEQEERLRLFERAIAASNNGIVISDAQQDNTVVYVNPYFEEMTGYSAAETVGKNCRFLQGKDRHQPGIEQLRDAIRQGKDCTVVLRNYRKDGAVFWNQLSLSPVENERGKISHFIGVQTDISDRKRAEEQLIHQAYYDSLTGLPNRAFFMDRLREATTKVEGRSDYLCAVLFIDLDRFKRVNDSLGHAVGDMLLIVIAHRLQLCLRPQDTIARLGGDHYVILLDDINTIEEATAVADRIHQQLNAPFTFEGHEVFVSASIGIALSSIEYEVSADLLRNADIAMYRAKAAGKACSAFFDRAMHDRAVEQLQLENDLRRELHEVEQGRTTSLTVSYQPIVSLFDGGIVGFEALVRWHHPQRGIISPGEFIPLAEETGAIVPLGAWVLRQACHQLAAWHAQFPSITQNRRLKVNVNLSGKQFLQLDLVDQIDRVLQETLLDPSCLKLEITESVLMEDKQAATQILLQLKQRQIYLALDDFGTGYSSLSHLAQFPIDTLKIDRSFVSGIGKEGKNLEIVQAIVTLAHALGMDVTAEGVETAAQLAELKALGCEDGQGYFFSPPMDAESATALLAGSFSCATRKISS